MFGLLQPEHLLLILLIVLIVFGAGKLPDTMRDVGRGVRTFRAEVEGKSTADPAPVVPAPVVAAPAITTTTCASCGKSSPANAKFCGECGKAL